MVEAAFEMQAQYFTNFTHGQLWVCHVAPDKASSVPRLTRVATSCGYCPAWCEIAVQLAVKSVSSFA